MEHRKQTLKRWLWPDGALAKAVILMIACLIAGAAIGYGVMKRPQFETKLLKVVDEGEWLRIEYQLISRSPFKLSLNSYGPRWPKPDQGMIYLNLIFDGLNRQKISDQRSVQKYSGPWGGPTGGSKIVHPGETVHGITYLHQELADNDFFLGVVPNSGGWLLETITSLEKDWLSGKYLSRLLQPVQNYGEIFTPNQKITGTTGESLLKRSQQYLAALSAKEKQLLATQLGFKTLQQFVNDGELPVWLNDERISKFRAMENTIYELSKTKTTPELVQLLEALKEKQSYRTWDAER